DVPNYVGLYRISSLGRIYSLPRKDSKGRNKGGLFKSTPVGRNGNYNTVTLNNQGVKKSHDVHRLMMVTFYPNTINECVNHKNGNKQHNWLSNLEWTTFSENRKHAYRTGLQSPVIGERKMTWETANEIRR